VSGFGRFLRRRAMRLTDQDLTAAVELSSQNWAPIARAVETATGVAALPNENVREHLARACEVTLSQVDRFVAAMRNGVKPKAADKEIFGKSPTPLSKTINAVFQSIRVVASCPKPHRCPVEADAIARACDGDITMDTLGALTEHGWDPVTDPIRAISRHTGVQPGDGELLFPYIARATGCGLAQVQQYMALMDDGIAPEKADHYIFGHTPSTLHLALDAGRRAVMEFAGAVSASRA